MINVSVPNLDAVLNELSKELSKVTTDKFVTVGVHQDDNARPDDTMTNARLGAIQHFGADIQHPGGTPYTIGSDGTARFVSKSYTGVLAGVTQPHTITIPARPWLDVGVASASQEIVDTIADAIEDGEPMDVTLNRVGLVAVAGVQDYMDELSTPGNAPSTIAKKGVDNPLIDTGELKQSVTYKITNTKPSEGI